MTKRSIKKLNEFPKAVYHGSTTEHKESLRNIRVDASRKKLDFGRGFYTTSVRKQAIEWAKGKSCSKYKPLILTYQVSYDILVTYNSKNFIIPNEDWARVVFNNRLEKENQLVDFDYVYGHLADGFMVGLIDDIKSGLKTFEDFKKEIIPTQCKEFYYDQLVFRTERSLEMLTLVEEEVL